VADGLLAARRGRALLDRHAQASHAQLGVAREEEEPLEARRVVAERDQCRFGWGFGPDGWE
jgi:hypothetical protein